MVRALVTGASGYVGSRLVRELHAPGEPVGVRRVRLKPRRFRSSRHGASWRHARRELSECNRRWPYHGLLARPLDGSGAALTMSSAMRSPPRTSPASQPTPASTRGVRWRSWRSAWLSTSAFPAPRGRDPARRGTTAEVVPGRHGGRRGLRALPNAALARATATGDAHTFVVGHAHAGNRDRRFAALPGHTGRRRGRETVDRRSSTDTTVTDKSGMALFDFLPRS